MARKENFRRTGEKDSLTGAEWVEVDVKVKDKEVKAKRRLFEDTDQLGGLTDEYLLKCVNYAEDLLVRAATTRENTDQTGKKAQRSEAMAHWKQNDNAGFAAFVMADGFTQAKLDAALEAYYAEHFVD